MRDFLLIFNYELKSLQKSTRSTLFTLALTSCVWGMFFALNIFSSDYTNFTLAWILFFALITSAGFANMAFVRERLSGSWEMFLASGVERKVIVLAKFVFSWLASFLSGVLTLFVAVLIAAFLIGDFPEISMFFVLALFLTATLTANAISAYFTIININPRAIQLINLAIMMSLAGLISFIDYHNFVGQVLILAIVILPAFLAFLLTPRALYNDKIVERVNY